MTTNIHIPKQANFHIACLVLELEKLQPKDAIEVMLMYIDELGLEIYFYGDICGQKISDPVDPIFDELGEVTKVMSLGKVYHFNSSSNMITVAAASCFDTTTISVSIFIIEGEKYYSLDETQLFLENTLLPVNALYMKKENLNTVKAKLPASQQPNSSVMSAGQGLTKQGERVEQFVTWLCREAQKTKTNDPTILQSYYKNIGEPTQEGVWTELTDFNSSLFSHGRDDFFKKQKMIKFRPGTGKGRSLVARG